MQRQNLCLAVLTILVCLGLSEAANACACSSTAPGACQGFQQGDVVFVGTVTETENITGDFPSSAAPNQGTDHSTNGTPAPASTAITRYHFRIQERFAGPDGNEIDVFSGGDDGDCGYQFKKDQEYLVFTHQGVDGRIYSTICDGTRPVSEGHALIPQLRAMKKGQRVASVYGVLRRSNPPFLSPPDDPDDPLPNIALRLRSKDDRFSTHTGPNGIYTFYDVRAGEYNFTASLPVRMELTQKTLTGRLPPFKIPNGACYEYNVDALPTGHIRGSVLGPDGKPVKIASVELYREGQYADNKPGLWGFQSVKGYFDFDHIGPGEYVMVYNRSNRHDPNSPYPRSFYPGTTDVRQAGRIKIKDGEQLQKIDIDLGNGYATRPLKVQVKWEHGRPPGNLTVMAQAEDDSGNPAAQRITDTIFEFPLLQTARYTISAWEDLSPERAAGGRPPNCTIPARIDAPTVSVDGSDSNEKEVILMFSAVECVKQDEQPSSQAN